MKQNRPAGCGVQGHDLECEACGVKLYGRNVEDVCRYKENASVGWVKCPNCEGRGTIRVPGGHGDMDTILCPICNPDSHDRMIGKRHPNSGRVWMDTGDDTSEPDLYQTVTLTLSDGRKLNFTGRAAIDVSDADKLKVVRVEFSKPRSLPQGMSFSINEGECQR